MAREYKKLKFTDNFMFCKVITHNPELCRHLLELILGKKIRRVEIKSAEQVMDITPEAKSIRLDVYLDDDAGTVYDLEMQTYEKKNLPRRLRYYQGIIDLHLIDKGDDYDRLPESVVVFICTFDYFKENLPFYIFEYRCQAMPELLLGDGTKKIFVNPYGDRTGLSEEVANFLDFIRDNHAADSFTQELEQAVENARVHKEWEVEYMNWNVYEMDHRIDKRIAREEGEKQGEYLQLIRQVCKKKAKGLSPEEAADQLESDIEQVKMIYKAIDAAGTTDDINAIYTEFIKA